MLLHRYGTISAQSHIFCIELKPSPFLLKLNGLNDVASLTIVKIDAEFSTKKAQPNFFGIQFGTRWRGLGKILALTWDLV